MLEALPIEREPPTRSMPRQETARPVAQQRPDAGWSARLGVGYTATSYAPATPGQSGVTVLLVGGVGQVYALAQYSQLESVTLATAGARAVIERHPLDLALGVDLFRGKLRPALELGVQADAVSRTTVIDDTRLFALDEATRWRYAVVPRARVWFSIVPVLEAFLSAGADVALDRVDYVVDSPGGQARIAGRVVRPRIEAGLGLRIPP